MAGGRKRDAQRGGTGDAQGRRHRAIVRRRARCGERLLGLAVALAALSGACRPAPLGEDLLAAAVAARGGPLPFVARESQVDLHRGMPGDWQFRLEFEEPQRLRFTLRTEGADQHWVSDGTTASTWLDSAEVNREPLAGSDMESIARWVAVFYLDALADPALFRWRPLDASELPRGASYGLEAWPSSDTGDLGDGADPAIRYRLLFDRRLRLVELRGPLSLPVIGGGEVRARFSDFREVDGHELSFAARYRVDGAPFFEERVLEQSVVR